MNYEGLNQDLFLRTAAVIDRTGLEILQRSKVAVFGLGGVGAACAEALARGGVGHLALVDDDRVQLSNINRQLIALHSTLGMEKTIVCKARLLDINPEAKIDIFPVFYGTDTESKVDLSQFNAIADCVDTLSAKMLLAKKATDHSFYLVSSMGTGNRMDPGRLRFADIYQTSVCPLARRMRKACREEGVLALRVLFSDEEPQRAINQDEDKRPVIGSMSFVPPVAGFMIAGEIIRHLLQEAKNSPDRSGPPPKLF